MKKEETIRIPAHNSIQTKYYCDTCGGSSEVKRCCMCGGDICYDCAIKTDFDSLKNGSWWGDYPSYFCPSCWEKGTAFTPSILGLREDEELLLTQWKLSCRKE